MTTLPKNLLRDGEPTRFLPQKHATDLERSSHQTHAAAKLQEHYTPRLAKIVARLYRRDFEIFGYSSSLAVPK